MIRSQDSIPLASGRYNLGGYTQLLNDSHGGEVVRHCEQQFKQKAADSFLTLALALHAPH